jgi:hypothetical protein
MNFLCARALRTKRGSLFRGSVTAPQRAGECIHSTTRLFDFPLSKTKTRRIAAPGVRV